MSKGISVIDIGTTGVRVLVAKIAEGRSPQIIAKADVVCKNAVKNMTIENTEAVSSAIEKALRRIKDQTGLIIKSAYFGISGDKISFMPNSDAITVNDDHSEDAEENIVTGRTIGTLLDRIASVDLYADEMLIDVLPRQFYVSYDDGTNDAKVSDPTGLNCSKIRADADIIIGKGDYMDIVKRCAEGAGIEVDGFVPYVFTVPYIVPDDMKDYFSEKSDKSVLVIDIGGGITEYALYYKGAPYTVGALPVGGLNLTNDLAVVLNITPSDAEQIKLDYPLADDALVTNDIDVELSPIDAAEKEIVKVSYIVQIMKARIESILDNVAAELEDEGIMSSLIDTVILTGDGINNFKGLDGVCESVIGKVPSVIDTARYTGMKSSYAYAGGMVRYMAQQLRYGRKPSKIAREYQQPQETAPETKKGKVDFVQNIKTKFKNMIDSFKD
ncbi:MAG: cell division protein FtsA [Ruminococcaceae bacterium]|nr:cell division protein FtsA [Oscillospiraceae bacterium]